MGYTDDRTRIWAASLNSNRFFIFDVGTDPMNPRLVRTIDDVAKVSGLTGPHTPYAIPGRILISMASGPDGATGPWPDALIPDVDDVVGQNRNAFTKWWSVARGKNGVIYVEVHVPDDAALLAGDYVSTLNLSFSDGSKSAVPVRLTVWDFRLPSTSSLPSAFGMSISTRSVREAGSIAFAVLAILPSRRKAA